jgi:hypothetical protein
MGSSFILTPGDVAREDWWRITGNGVAVGRWTMTTGNTTITGWVTGRLGFTIRMIQWIRRRQGQRDRVLGATIAATASAYSELDEGGGY